VNSDLEEDWSVWARNGQRPGPSKVETSYLERRKKFELAPPNVRKREEHRAKRWYIELLCQVKAGAVDDAKQRVASGLPVGIPPEKVHVLVVWARYKPKRGRPRNMRGDKEIMYRGPFTSRDVYEIPGLIYKRSMAEDTTITLAGLVANWPELGGYL